MDIVERLRQGIERGEEADAEAAMDKAADEIDRLKRAISEAMSDFQRYVDANEALIEAKAEIERLRAMLLERGQERAHQQSEQQSICLECGKPAVGKCEGRQQGVQCPWCGVDHSPPCEWLNGDEQQQAET